MQLIKTIRSFGPAFKGIKSGFLSENNFRIHLVATVAVLVSAFLLSMQKNDWLWLIVAIGIVWITEYLNTALEKLTDMVSPQHNPLAGKVKDISASAVLIACITAAVIGVVVIGPYLFDLFSRW